MEARNLTLSDWFVRIRTGQIKLPRFQRHEAWRHNEIGNLLETVLRGLPAGATLVLEIGDDEPFQSRYLKTAPDGDSRVTEHLLDGQQRLTALWRALHDNYADRTYLVHWVKEEHADGSEEEVPQVLSQARWARKGVRYPVWCDDPRQVWQRGYIPVRLLNPKTSAEVQTWADTAAADDLAMGRTIERRILELRGRVASYNVPYLSLPVTTPKDVALEVFIKMNTSSVRLTAYDIVVAQLEEATGQSLHELVDDLKAAVPSLARLYDSPGNVVLDVAALRSDRPATQASYQRLDMQRVHDEWQELVDGIAWAVRLLEDESVHDAARLPSVVPLPVLAALHQFVPAGLDAAGNARMLARAYLWRSFLTRRYEQSAATRALQDLRGMRVALEKATPLDQVSAPVFDEELTPLPTVDDLLAAGWPKGRDILGRGILAAALRSGAEDMADGQPARADNLRQREYHHLFPDSLLTGPGGLTEGHSYRALNCALITWSTNRNISNKSPLQYLQERVDGAHLGEEAVRRRLGSHLIPYDELAVAGPYDNSDVGERVRADYSRFMRARAERVLPALHALCRGVPPP